MRLRPYTVRTLGLPKYTMLSALYYRARCTPRGGHADGDATLSLMSRRRGSSPKRRVGLLLTVFAVGCGAPPAEFETVDPAWTDESPQHLESVDSHAQALSTPTLKASAVKMWSNLNRDRSTSAHYVACPGQPFLMNFTLKNKGSAVWRDVKGRGKTVGTDVFLETANGKTDGLTGKVRYSLKKNANDYVRGGRKGKNCTSQRGCNKTRSIKGGMKATAPLKVGVYKGRWRLRDYSKAWGMNSKGFGPKVEMRIRVDSCAAPWCGCKVQCENGSIHDVTADIQSDAICQSVGESLCPGATLASHLFRPCPTSGSGGASSGGAGGSGGTYNPPGGYAGNPGDEDEDDPPGSWYFEEESGNGGGTAGSGGTGNGGTGNGGSGAWGPGEDEPDDPDYTPSGFDGVDEAPERGSVEEGASSCSVGKAPGDEDPALAMLLLLGLAGAARRRSKTDAGEARGARR